MSKSYDNARDLDFIDYIPANNSLNFNATVISGGAPIVDATAGVYANGAYLQANASYQTINTNSVLNRSEYIQANNTINFNVAITANGQSIAGDGLSPFLLMGA